MLSSLLDRRNAAQRPAATREVGRAAVEDFADTAEDRTAAAAMPVSEVLDVVDRATLPLVFAGARIAARATSNSEIEVRVHDQAGQAAGWWARAYGDDGVIVAAAPLKPAGRDALSRLLLPPQRLDRVVIDVTDAPGEPRPGEILRAIANAIDLGRAAARAERLRRSETSDLWRSTSEAWTQAGDPARAGLAAERADGTGRRTQPPPAALLSDYMLG